MEISGSIKQRLKDMIPQRIIAGVMACAVFFTNVVFPYGADESFWKERRRAVDRFKNNGENNLLASLPLQNLPMPNTGNFYDIVNNIPVAVGAKFMGRRLKPSTATTPDKSGNYIALIPSAYAHVKDVFQTTSSQQVILIQDVHLNNEAQLNIANILTEVINNPSPPPSPPRGEGRVRGVVIGVEGAFGEFDFLPFRAFPGGIRKKVGDYYLKDNKIAAPSYVGITAGNMKEKPVFVGVDDSDHYLANVAAFRSAITQKKLLSDTVLSWKKDLAARKFNALNSKLQEFDKKQALYWTGEIGIGEFLKTLVFLSPRGLGAQWDDMRVIKLFLEAYDMEKTLDFKQVEQERALVAEKLATTINEAELKQLISQSASYKAGQISFADYYRFIRSVLASHAIPLDDVPAFNAYVRYVIISDGIESEKLFSALEQLRTKVLSALCFNREEKELMSQTRYLCLIEKLLDFALTPEEWGEYKRFKPKAQSAIAGLKPFETFYEEADIRSKKMVANLVKEAQSNPPSSPFTKGGKRGIIILVAGGFHTPAITRLLKEKGLSYVVVQPKITKIDSASGTEYLSIFNREKTPLDKLFQGEKLFLAPSFLTAGTGTAEVAGLEREILSVMSFLAATSGVELSNNLPVKVSRDANGIFMFEFSPENRIYAIEAHKPLPGGHVKVGEPKIVDGKAIQFIYPIRNSRNVFSAWLPSKRLKEVLWAITYISILSLPFVFNFAGNGLLSTIQSYGLWTMFIILGSLISVSSHEFAHAFVASRIKDVTADAKRLTLNPFSHLFEGNRLSKAVHNYADSSVSNMKIAAYIAAGPIANTLLGILGLTLAGLSDLFQYQVFAWINFALAGYNLLPIILEDSDQNHKDQEYFDGASIMQFIGLKPFLLKHSFFSSAIFGFAGRCPPMIIAEVNRRVARALEGNEKRSQDEVKKRRKEAGIKLVKTLKPFIEGLAETAAQDSKVKTNVDEKKVEQAAGHAIQDAVDNAVKNKDFSEETFKATVEERMAAQLRSAENGGMTEDDEATVREVLNRLKDKGVSFGNIANAWQKEFAILDSLSGLPDEEKWKLAQEIGHGSHHHESLPDQHLEGHHHTHTHLFTPIDGLILNLLKKGLFFIARCFALSVTTTTTEDVYAWLKSKVPELTDEDMQLLKEMTDDKALQTDRPLKEQPDVLSNIVTALNVPYGQKNNVILVGKEGVGKSTQLRLIDQKLKAGQFKGPITERRFLSLKGSLDPVLPDDRKKFETLLQVLTKTKGRIMLFADEFHKLTRGRNNTTDYALADTMKTYLEDGLVTIIGATTFSELRQFISGDRAYQRRFHIIQAPEPNDSQTEDILLDYKPYFEKEFGLEIAEDVIPAVVQLTGDFLPEESFPAKAVDTLKYACSTAYNTYNNLALEMSSTMQTLRDSINKYISMAKRGKEDSDDGVVLYNKILALANYLRQMELQRTTLESNRVTQGIVRTYLTKKTGIDILNVTEGKAQKYLDMESALQERVAGQTEAVVAISKAIRRAKSGLKDPNRPISSFMFVGPTGVGKTELAKAVAKFEFGDDEAAMIRIDMSEYMESHSVARLIGAPPGYVGHDEGGQLTEKALRRPYSLILFDEIEKAHPDVWNILLQVLDDGRLTDGKGQTVNFKNTIIVLSSNIGMNRVQDELGALSEKLKTANSPEEMQEIINHMNHAVAQGVKDGFEEAVRIGRIKPEFLNRLDGQIVFNVLTPPVMEQIARIQLNRDLADLLMRQGYVLQSTPEVYKFLAQKGLDPVYGARPLKRVIDKNVKDPLADFILEAHAKRQGLNGGVVHLFINEGKVEFRIEEKPKGAVNRSEPSSAVQPLMVLIEEIIDSPETQMSEIDIAKKLEVDTGKQGTSSEELGPVKLNMPLEFTAQGERVSHNVNPNRKNDKGVDEAQEAIITLLKSKNPPEKAIAVFNKWFKEFVKIAKQLAKQRTESTSVVIRWTMDESDVLHVAIDQRNRILPEVIKELRPSLQPDVKTDDEILEAEYILAEEGKPVNRTLMELKRDIAGISGSSFGLAGSQYWLQLAPIPVAPPQPVEPTRTSQPTPPVKDEPVPASPSDESLPESTPRPARTDEPRYDAEVEVDASDLFNRLLPTFQPTPGDSEIMLETIKFLEERYWITKTGRGFSIRLKRVNDDTYRIQYNSFLGTYQKYSIDHDSVSAPLELLSSVLRGLELGINRMGMQRGDFPFGSGLAPSQKQLLQQKIDDLRQLEQAGTAQPSSQPAQSTSQPQPTPQLTPKSVDDNPPSQPFNIQELLPELERLVGRYSGKLINEPGKRWVSGTLICEVAITFPGDPRLFYDSFKDESRGSKFGWYEVSSGQKMSGEALMGILLADDLSALELAKMLKELIIEFPYYGYYDDSKRENKKRKINAGKLQQLIKRLETQQPDNISRDIAQPWVDEMLDTNPVLRKIIESGEAVSWNMTGDTTYYFGSELTLEQKAQRLLEGFTYTNTAHRSQVESVLQLHLARSDLAEQLKTVFDLLQRLIAVSLQTSTLLTDRIVINLSDEPLFISGDLIGHAGRQSKSSSVGPKKPTIYLDLGQLLKIANHPEELLAVLEHEDWHLQGEPGIGFTDPAQPNHHYQSEEEYERVKLFVDSYHTRAHLFPPFSGSLAAHTLGFNPLSYLKDPDVMRVFLKYLEVERYNYSVISGYYKLGGEPGVLQTKAGPMRLADYIKSIADFLKDGADQDIADITEEYWRRFPHPKELDHLERELYGPHMEWLRDIIFLKDIIPGEGVVADIGCGANRLGRAILKFSDEMGLAVRQVIGTDITVPNEQPGEKDRRLTFETTIGNELPIASESVDLAILKWSLHHMSPNQQERQLRAVMRILKPGKSVVILEPLLTTWDAIESEFKKELENEETWPPGPLLDSFLNMNEDFYHLSLEQQRAVLALDDYFAHVLMWQRTYMPQPFTYLPLSWTIELFQRLGFRENESMRRVLGIPPIVHSGPFTIRLVFRKPGKMIQESINQEGVGETKKALVAKGMSRRGFIKTSVLAVLGSALKLSPVSEAVVHKLFSGFDPLLTITTPVAMEIMQWLPQPFGLEDVSIHDWNRVFWERRGIKPVGRDEMLNINFYKRLGLATEDAMSDLQHELLQWDFFKGSNHIFREEILGRFKNTHETLIKATLDSLGLRYDESVWTKIRWGLKSEIESRLIGEGRITELVAQNIIQWLENSLSGLVRQLFEPGTKELKESMEHVDEETKMDVKRQVEAKPDTWTTFVEAHIARIIGKFKDPLTGQYVSLSTEEYEYAHEWLVGSELHAARAAFHKISDIAQPWVDEMLDTNPALRKVIESGDAVSWDMTKDAAYYFGSELTSEQKAQRLLEGFTYSNTVHRSEVESVLQLHLARGDLVERLKTVFDLLQKIIAVSHQASTLLTDRIVINLSDEPLFILGELIAHAGRQSKPLNAGPKRPTIYLDLGQILKIASHPEELLAILEHEDWHLQGEPGNGIPDSKRANHRYQNQQELERSEHFAKSLRSNITPKQITDSTTLIPWYHGNLKGSEQVIKQLRLLQQSIEQTGKKLLVLLESAGNEARNYLDSFFEVYPHITLSKWFRIMESRDATIEEHMRWCFMTWEYNTMPMLQLRQRLRKYTGPVPEVPNPNLVVKLVTDFLIQNNIETVLEDILYEAWQPGILRELWSMLKIEPLGKNDLEAYVSMVVESYGYLAHSVTLRERRLIQQIQAFVQQGYHVAIVLGAAHVPGLKFEIGESLQVMGKSLRHEHSWYELAIRIRLNENIPEKVQIRLVLEGLIENAIRRWLEEKKGPPITEYQEAMPIAKRISEQMLPKELMKFFLDTEVNMNTEDIFYPELPADQLDLAIWAHHLEKALDFLTMKNESKLPMDADILLLLGNDKLDVIKAAAEVSSRVNMVASVGGRGRLTKGLIINALKAGYNLTPHFPVREAVVMRDILIALGVPKELIEPINNSTNTPQNIDNFLAWAKKNYEFFESVIVMQTPIQMIRTMATVAPLFAKEFRKIDDYYHTAGVPAIDILSIETLYSLTLIVVDEFRKLEEYADNGSIAVVDTSDVQKNLDFLRRKTDTFTPKKPKFKFEDKRRDLFQHVELWLLLKKGLSGLNRLLVPLVIVSLIGMPATVWGFEPAALAKITTQGLGINSLVVGGVIGLTVILAATSQPSASIYREEKGSRVANIANMMPIESLELSELGSHLLQRQTKEPATKQLNVWEIQNDKTIETLQEVLNTARNNPQAISAQAFILMAAPGDNSDDYKKSEEIYNKLSALKKHYAQITISVISQDDSTDEYGFVNFAGAISHALDTQSEGMNAFAQAILNKHINLNLFAITDTWQHSNFISIQGTLVPVSSLNVQVYWLDFIRRLVYSTPLSKDINETLKRLHTQQEAVLQAA